MSLLMYRHELESFLDADPHDLLDLWKGAWRSLDDGLRESITDAERRLYGRPVGGWSELERRNVLWRLESAAVLRFARGERGRLPFHTEAGLPETVFPERDWEKSVHSVTRPLRGRDELERMFGLSEALRAVSLRWLKGKKPLRRELRELQAQLSRAADEELLPGPVEQLSVEQKSLVFEVTLERSHALRWLLGISRSDWGRVEMGRPADINFFRELSPCVATSTTSVLLRAGRGRSYAPRLIEKLLIPIGYDRTESGYTLLFDGNEARVDVATKKGPDAHTPYLRFSSGGPEHSHGLAAAAAMRTGQYIIDDRYGELEINAEVPE